MSKDVGGTSVVAAAGQIGGAIVPVFSLGASRHAVNTSLLFASATALVGGTANFHAAVEGIMEKVREPIMTRNGFDPASYQALVLAGRHRKRRREDNYVLARLRDYLPISSIEWVPGLHKSCKLFKLKAQAVPLMLPNPPAAPYPIRPSSVQADIESALVVARHRCALKKFTEHSKLTYKGKPKHIITSDMFFYIRKMSSFVKSRSTTAYYHMADAVDHSGPEIASQLFHLYEIVDGACGWSC